MLAAHQSHTSESGRRLAYCQRGLGRMLPILTSARTASSLSFAFIALTSFLNIGMDAVNIHAFLNYKSGAYYLTIGLSLAADTFGLA